MNQIFRLNIQRENQIKEKKRKETSNQINKE